MRSLLLLCCIICTGHLCGQNKQLLYNVDDLPQTLLSNPGASVAFEKHIGIPLLSGFSLQAGSSGVSVYDIFQEGGDINARISAAISDMNYKDFFMINQQLEILSFGWLGRSNNMYYSAGLYQETDAIAYFPKDIAVLAYEGNADYINRPFQFSDVSVSAEVLSVYHFGVNKKLSRKLQLGARAKIYMSTANVNSTNNEGTFITRTTPEGPNFYSHEVLNANVTANSSGLTGLINGDEEVSDVIGRTFFSNNMGLGVDIGGTYTFTEHWTATASMLDIGAVFHLDNLQNYRLSGSHQIDGIELEFPALVDGNATTDYWDEFVDEVEVQIPYEDALSERYTTWRPLKFNTSVNYAFGYNLNGDCDCTNNGVNRYENNVGLQVYGIKRPQGLQGAITAYYDKLWKPWLRTKLSYTYDAFTNRNIGLLISTKINKFNVYLAADNLLDYPNITKARSASFQFGFQLVFDPK